MKRLAKKQTPVAETTEETNAPDTSVNDTSVNDESVSDAPQEINSNEVESETVADETAAETPAVEAADEAVANETAETPAVEATDEAVADEAPANEAVAEAPAQELAPAEPESPAERVEVEDGRDYELMFIVRITESTDEATKRVRTLIEGSGGAVDNVRVSEQRRLQYPIKKEIEGFYIVVNGRFTKEAATELDRELKLDEAVLRHMTIRLDEE